MGIKNRNYRCNGCVGSNIRVDSYDWEVKRILPIINEDITRNGYLIKLGTLVTDY